MKKFVALLTEEKRKIAMKERENDNCNILRAVYSVYKKIWTILFPILVKLFKERYISSAKRYKQTSRPSTRKMR